MRTHSLTEVQGIYSESTKWRSCRCLLGLHTDMDRLYLNLHSPVRAFLYRAHGGWPVSVSAVQSKLQCVLLMYV
jgi:hypothetical protein